MSRDTWRLEFFFHLQRTYRNLQNRMSILWLFLVASIILCLREAKRIDFRGYYYDFVSFDDSLEPANVAYATAVIGDSYVPGVLALICSIRAHDPSVRSGKTDIVVFYDDISEQKRLEIVALEGVRLVDASYIKSQLGIGKNNLRKGCYYKHDIWNMVEYSKIVWMDSDTIVVKDPTRLFKFIGEFGVVGHRNTKTQQKFNSGVMVLRPDKKVARRLWEILDTGSFKGQFDMTSGDAFVGQDVVNQYWFVERGLSTGGLPVKYNWRPRFHPTSSLMRETVIVHYPGEPKVWDLEESAIKGVQFQTKPLPQWAIELFWKYHPVDDACQISAEDS